MVEIALAEWETRGPEPGSVLAQRRLVGEDARREAARLAGAGILRVSELASGIEVESFAHVGRIMLGDLQITIRPKLRGAPLLGLLRYAYGLRELKLTGKVEFGSAAQTFQDLLCDQLATEAEELWVRGLQRRYLRIDEVLASPRGRIDIQALARQNGVVSAALPCTHYPREEDHLINQVLLAGLQLSARLTEDLPLRGRLRRMAARLADGIRPARLDAETLDEARRAVDRLTRAYGPAITLIELLAAGQGISLDGRAPTQPLHGFLFDMNRFFQDLLARYLHEYLEGLEVRDQYQIPDAMAYASEYNPRMQPAPVLRPDFAVLRGPRIAAILDAKYRDVWEKGLPPHMLYQLAIYALSQAERQEAVILYATMNAAAREERIELRVSLRNAQRAQVVLRPVNLLRLDGLLKERRHAERECRTYARYLTFGED